MHDQVAQDNLAIGLGVPSRTAASPNACFSSPTNEPSPGPTSPAQAAPREVSRPVQHAKTTEVGPARDRAVPPPFEPTGEKQGPSHGQARRRAILTRIRAGRGKARRRPILCSRKANPRTGRLIAANWALLGEGGGRLP